MITTLPLSSLRLDRALQPRVEMDQAVIEEYAEAIRSGAEFPPITVFDDGQVNWLADGFHRVHGHQQAGRTEISCDVRQGTRRDALLFSAGANAAHGLRRTNADKRRAVLVLLQDEKVTNESDREIAKRAGVSNRFVSDLRNEMQVSVNGSQIDPSSDLPKIDRTVRRNGSTYTMDTSRIGRTAQQEPANGHGTPAEAEDPDADDEQLPDDSDQSPYPFSDPSDAAGGLPSDDAPEPSTAPSTTSTTGSGRHRAPAEPAPKKRLVGSATFREVQLFSIRRINETWTDADHGSLMALLLRR